ncbi:SDR family oxidoreductase [Galbibacter mesophilus]|uniref:SDR family oxidoreductase n=1 Tax=Galbibacter mesophilus TaxID=379069 RepID=UPI00191DCBC5|nr:SDR family oxidoreductase [Galbibacter mesophilus]MCM5662329.1 SDR family oxidoreductase [Galbibacter mesophilus]
MEKALVAGANGTTGKIVVALLNKSQYFTPVAMVRQKDQIGQFEDKNIETILGDLQEDLTHTVKGIDKIIFAAGSGGKNVVEVDQEGAKRLIDVAKIANVKKFVMLSSMGADEPESVEKLQDYLKAKQKADVHLRNSGLNYSIVRPGMLNNEQPSGKIQLSEKLNKQGEISRADVAQTLVRALHDDSANEKTFEILNGETLIAEALDKA